VKRAFACALFPLAACAPAAAPPPSPQPIATAPTNTANTPSASASGVAAPVPTGDAGNDDGWNVVVDLAAPPAQAAIPEQEKVLTLVVGPHVSDASACAGTSVVATIGGGFAGAFTAKGATEKAYLISVRACAGGPATNHFVVIEGDTKIRVDAKVGETQMFSIHDLDGDGDNEILLVGTNAAGETIARLYTAEDADLETLADFGVVGRPGCHPARILYRVSGKSMDFHTDKTRMTCP
jgi:hypothetical protein